MFNYPNPNKYDHYLVNKYSLSKKLKAMKKPQNEKTSVSPSFEVTWNYKRISIPVLQWLLIIIYYKYLILV